MWLYFVRVKLGADCTFTLFVSLNVFVTFFGLLLLLQRRCQTSSQTCGSPHQCTCLIENLVFRLEASQPIWMLIWNGVGFRPWPPWAALKAHWFKQVWSESLDGALGQAAAFQLLCRTFHRPDCDWQQEWKVPMESVAKWKQRGGERHREGRVRGHAANHSLGVNWNGMVEPQWFGSL